MTDKVVVTRHEAVTLVATRSQTLLDRDRAVERSKELHPTGELQSALETAQRVLDAAQTAVIMIQDELFQAQEAKLAFEVDNDELADESK